MELLPVSIFWVLAIWCFFRGYKHLMFLLFGMLPLWSFAVIPTSVTGGITFLSTPIIEILIITRVLINPKHLHQLLSVMTSPKGALLLTMFLFVAIVVTIFGPRIFSGTHVVLLSDPKNLNAVLRPSTQNITQSVYLAITVLTVGVFSIILRYPSNMESFVKALVFGGAVTVLTGGLDFTSQFVPIKPFLDLFRTANYQILTEHTVAGGLKRVVGLAPEASVFAAICVRFLILIYFFSFLLSSFWYRERIVPFAISGLCMSILLSTSSGGYVAAAVFGLFAIMFRMSQFVRGKIGRGSWLEVLVAYVCLGSAVCVLIVIPSTFDPLVELVDKMVFQKTSSLSFEERSMWSQIALNAMWETNGFGVGLGGARASGYLIAVASNTGVLGVSLFVGFLVQMFFVRSSKMEPGERKIISAFRWSLIPILVPSLLSSTTTDFGPHLATLLGLVLAVSMDVLRSPPPIRGVTISNQNQSSKKSRNSVHL